MSENKLYLKGLNGIRAVAAFSVLLFHTLPSYKIVIAKDIILGQQGGEYRVTVFFTLSGFLITLLLEKENTKTINLKNYIRIF